MSKNYCKIGKIWCKNCSHHGCKYNLIQPTLNNIRPLNTLNTCPKRNNDRTISFKELIMNSSFNDIMNAMYIHHHDEKKSLKSSLLHFIPLFYLVHLIDPCLVLDRFV